MKKTLKLSFDPSGRESAQTVSAKQLDHLSRVLCFSFDRELPSGAVLSLRAKRPDSVSYELAVTEEDGVYSVRLTDSLLAVSGRIECDVAVTAVEGEGFSTLSTEIFYIESVASAMTRTSRLGGEVETVPTLIARSLSAAKSSGEFDGKTAYLSALDGGYEGTEEEFNASLASIPSRLSELTDDPLHRTVSDTDIENWNSSPRALSELTDDPLHRTVSDTDIENWNSSPRALSELTDDEAHRTVSDADIAAWNALPTVSEVENLCSGARSGAADDIRSLGLFSGMLYTELASDIQKIGRLSPLASTATVSLTRKNLIPFPYASEGATQNGLTFTVGSDGYVTVNGTASAKTVFYVTNSSQKYENGAKHSMTLYGAVSGVYLTVAETAASIESFSGNRSFFPRGAAYIVGITVDAGKTVSSLRVAPQVELGEPSEGFSLYGTETGGELGILGTNLLPPFPSKTENGVTFYSGGTGTLLINGTSTGEAACTLNVSLPAGKYAFAANNNKTFFISGAASGRVRFYGADGAQLASVTLSGTNVKMPVNVSSPIAKISVVIREGVTLSGMTLKPQLERGSKYSEYTEYTKRTLDFGSDETAETELFAGAVLIPPVGQKVCVRYPTDISAVIADIEKRVCELEQKN